VCGFVAQDQIGGLLPVAPVVHLRRGWCGSGHVRRRRRESLDLCGAGGSRAVPAGRDSVLGDQVRWKSPGSLAHFREWMDRRGYDRKRTGHQCLHTLILIM
jgi:hypothetical protein